MWHLHVCFYKQQVEHAAEMSDLQADICRATEWKEGLKGHVGQSPADMGKLCRPSMHPLFTASEATWNGEIWGYSTCLYHRSYSKGESVLCRDLSEALCTCCMYSNQDLHVTGHSTALPQWAAASEAQWDSASSDTVGPEGGQRTQGAGIGIEVGIGIRMLPSPQPWGLSAASTLLKEQVCSPFHPVNPLFCEVSLQF